MGHYANMYDDEAVVDDDNVYLTIAYCTMQD
jgi:hypothetical protein